MRPVRIAPILTFLAGALIGRVALAQVAVDVTVLDKTADIPIVDVMVTLTNLDTGTTLLGATDVVGAFRFGGLSAVGRWQAIVAATQDTLEARSDIIELRSQYDTSLIIKVVDRASETGYETIVTTKPTTLLINRTNGEVSSTLNVAQMEKIPIESRAMDRALYRMPNVTLTTGFFPEAPVVSINGANGLYTNYMVDGLDNNENFLGGQKFPVPVGMMQDVTVLAAGYGVEYGRTANGVVNVTSRGGSNDYKNEVFFVTRPGGWFTKDISANKGINYGFYGNPVSSSFTRYQGGGVAIGPIVKDKAFYLVDIEYTGDNTTNLLSSPLLGGDESVNGTNHSLLMSTRLDWNVDDRWRLTLRANEGLVTIANPGGGLSGGATFPSAGSFQDRNSTLVAFTATRKGDLIDYTGSVQYSRFRWNYSRSPQAGPQITIQNSDASVIGIVGNSGSAFDDIENTVQTKHVLTSKIGQHTFKGGTDVLIESFGLLGGGNPDGNINVTLNDDQIAAVRALNRGSGLGASDIPGDAAVNSAVYEGKTARFGRTQQLYGVFLEDSIALTPKWVATFGLRWDYDSLSKGGAAHGDFNNVAPRFSTAWSVLENLSLRGSSGIFYEKIPYTVMSDALQQNSTNPTYLNQLQQLKNQGVLPSNTNLNRITYNGNHGVSAACATLAQCPSGAAARAAAGSGDISGAELRILNPKGYANPYAWQTTLGADWKFQPHWMFRVTGIMTYGYNLVRLRDLNAPAAYSSTTPRNPLDANATRPVSPTNPDGSPTGFARSVVESETGGHSRYFAMNVSLLKERWEDWWDMSFYYTLSRLQNDTDDVNFRSSDANQFSRDWGPSLNDRTHVFSVINNLYPFKGFTFTTALLFQSGQPYNKTPPGTADLNGDGLSFADQYTGNPDREPGTHRNSGRLPWSFNVDMGAGYDIPLATTRLRIRADVFNVFNTQNWSGYASNFTASNQFQAQGGPNVQRSVSPPRTAQFTAQWFF